MSSNSYYDFAVVRVLGKIPDAAEFVLVSAVLHTGGRFLNDFFCQFWRLWGCGTGRSAAKRPKKGGRKVI